MHPYDIQRKYHLTIDIKVRNKIVMMPWPYIKHNRITFVIIDRYDDNENKAPFV